MTEKEEEDPSTSFLHGVCYWGCESKLHKLCIEADQRPKLRTWSEVMEYMSNHPEDAAKMALLREGELSLTPLAVICQEGPLDVIQALVDLAPEAIRIADRYGDLPIHRTALQNRDPIAGPAILTFFKDMDVSTLLVKDGWGRTPLICALESGRGPLNSNGVAILATNGAVTVETKKGLLPLDIVTNGKASNVKNEDKIKLLEILQ